MRPPRVLAGTRSPTEAQAERAGKKSDLTSSPLKDRGSLGAECRDRFARIFAGS